MKLGLVTVIVVSLMLIGQTNTSRNDLALVGGTVYAGPDEPPIRDAVVLIRDGKIAAAGGRPTVRLDPAVPTINCSGLTITAGFWNSHVHFTERKWANVAAIPAPELTRQLQEMLTRYGFTGAFDLSSAWDNTRRLRDRIESGEVAGPRIKSTGEALLPPDGLPPDIVVSMMGWMKVDVPEIANVAQAEAASSKLLEAGVDGIKLFASAQRGATMAQSTIEAAVAKAHRWGKPVFVHPNTAADVLTAVRGGVDVIAHTTPSSGPWDKATIAAMMERHVALIPTLWIWKYYARHDRASTQDQTAGIAVGQLREWLGAGGTVLFGNDLGAVDYDPTAEYMLMSEAGMSFPQILASLTTTPAGRFGLSKQIGRIAADFDADITVFNGDPSQDLRSLATVQYTLRQGKIIYRGNTP